MYIIEEIEKMLTEISAWPWFNDFHQSKDDRSFGWGEIQSQGDKLVIEFNNQNFKDVEFIASSPQITSHLVEEVKWQRELVWNQSKHITNLSEENSRLRQALSFYENEDNYKMQPIRDEYDHLIECSDSCPIYEDNGKIAKKALEEKCE